MCTQPHYVFSSSNTISCLQPASDMIRGKQSRSMCVHQVQAIKSKRCVCVCVCVGGGWRVCQLRAVRGTLVMQTDGGHKHSAVHWISPLSQLLPCQSLCVMEWSYSVCLSNWTICLCSDCLLICLSYHLTASFFTSFFSLCVFRLTFWAWSRPSCI